MKARPTRRGHAVLGALQLVLTSALSSVMSFVSLCVLSCLLLCVLLCEVSCAAGSSAPSSKGSESNAGEPSASERDGAAGLESTRPRLVLLLVVDQLRRDRIGAELPGGLGRLAREGRSFTDAALGHGLTDTCPGHVAISTGRHPASAGITGNRFIDRERLEVTYCVADEGPAGRLVGGATRVDPSKGRSPRNLRATTLGDWLKAQSPASRVFAVSAKDRSAIVLGGKQPDAAYWLDRNGTGRFLSSRHYHTTLPPWVARWTAEAVLAPLPASWEHATGDPPNGTRPDDFVGESTRLRRTSPHPIRRDDDALSVEPLLATPYLDGRTLDFAQELVDTQELGRDEHVDLLALGLSGIDYIGHHYGPFSQESRDALERLDRRLGEFIAFLEQRAGRGRLIVVLSADHGVLPLPEWSAAQQRQCPVASGRISPKALDRGLVEHLNAALGGGERRLFVREKYTLMFDPEGAATRGVGVERVSALAESYLEQQPGVARTWQRSEIMDADASEPIAALYRNSLADGRDADLVIQPAYGCLFTSYPTGTSHGSPYDYDRNVPLILFGPGIRAGRVPGPAATVDIAPTLASLLGIEAPADLDGVVLPLGDQPDRATDPAPVQSAK